MATHLTLTQRFGVRIPGPQPFFVFGVSMVKKFSLPNYYAYGDNMIRILKYKQEHPQYFYKDRVVDSCYDVHPSLIWAGGRNPKVMKIPEIPMAMVLKKFSQFPEVSLRHVLTNSLITPVLLQDYNCNHFLKMYIRKGDAVIAANLFLIEYLKDKYPDIPIIYSTTMGITDVDKINEITKTNIYVMNYNFNNDNDYLDRLEHKENLEILCAEPCAPNCPNRMMHYQTISQSILDIPHPQFTCRSNSEARTFDDIMKLPHAISNDRVEELSEMGIQYFKISGRTFNIPNWLYAILYYLVKPEYLLHVYLDILNTWW